MMPFTRIRKTIVGRISPGIRSRLRAARNLSLMAWRDLRVHALGSVLPLKPRAISMMVNDICNSRCQMCLIWQQKKDHEISAEELRDVLDEPVFSKVDNIGVTGGEPTLRKDLPEIFRVIARRRPRVAHASMITNAIREKIVEEQVLECARICREEGVGFSVMVSLDGLGEVHDTVRGRAGNFASALGCLERFRSEDISTSFGCTITKSNVSHVDDLLDWAEGNGFYGRFRVAEFIDRLYNAPQADFIRSFNELERYHLGLFFYRAATEYEPSSAVQKTYRSIRGMLAEGKPRTTGCPYHHDTVILTSRGELLYCSPKSPNLGSILQRGTAGKVYFGNLRKRQEIRQQHCDDCIHDYHVPETFREKVGFYWKCRRNACRFDCATLTAKAGRLPAAATITTPDTLAGGKVLIVGWYGTETAGDKAILVTIVERLKKRSRPPEEIILSSLHPFVSRHTLLELGLPDMRIVETFEAEFREACQSADEVVVGGGPLMDLEALNHILYAFIQAQKRGKTTRVEGCGIGPLTNPRYIRTVKEILRLANLITLRDGKSTRRCVEEFQREARVVEDPATDYVRAWRNAHSHEKMSLSGPEGDAVDVACFLREWGTDYAGDMTADEFQSKKEAFERGLEAFLARLITEGGLRVGLYPMHSFSVGGDDRKFNRRLAARLVENHGVPPESLHVARLPMSPSELLDAMRRSKMNLCMRFHSVLFAETLGAPYLAIDYTRGGKIQAFLEERGRNDRLVSLKQVAAGGIHPVFTHLHRSII